jgi:hypothetical protein
LNSGTNNSLLNATWTGSRFIIVGDKGTVFTSESNTSGIHSTSFKMPFSSEQSHSTIITNRFLKIALPFISSCTFVSYSLFKINGLTEVIESPQIYNNQINADLKHFSSGIYYLQIKANSSKYFIKVIKR